MGDDITIIQGAAYVRTFEVLKDGQEQDLAGATISFRVHPGGATADIFTVPFILDPTSTDGKIYGASLTVPANTLANLTPYTVYYYEVVLVDSAGTPEQVARGRVFVAPARQ